MTAFEVDGLHCVLHFNWYYS